MSAASARTGLTFPAISPSKGTLASQALAGSAPVVPTMADQMSDRTLWVFIAVGIAVAAVCVYLFTTAEKDADNTLIADHGGIALSDNVPIVTVLGSASILATAYACYRAYKSFEGDSEASAKRGWVVVLFALNMFLTAVWFNQYYGHADTASQTPTSAALGAAAITGLMVLFFWETDRVCAGFALASTAVSLAAAYAGYKLAVDHTC